MDLFEEIRGDLPEIINEYYKKTQYSLMDITLFVTVSQSVQKLRLTKEQSCDLLQKVISAAVRLKNTDAVYILFMADQMYHIAVCSNDTEVFFDSGIEVADSCSLSEISHKIKLKYQKQLSKK